MNACVGWAHRRFDRHAERPSLAPRLFTLDGAEEVVDRVFVAGPMSKSVFRIALVAALAAVVAFLWFTFRDAGRSPQPPQSAQLSGPGAMPPTPDLSPPSPPPQPTTGAVSAPNPGAAPDPGTAAQPDALALEVPEDRTAADELFLSTLTDLVTRKSVKEFFQTDALARRVVATTDCLSRVHCSWTVWPVSRTPGRFSVVPSADGSGGTLSTSNSVRYTAIVQFVDSIDTPKWVLLYRQVYPMLQKAYVELGYPNDSFHDRLLQVIDHLLAAPVMSKAPLLQLVEVRGPVASLQPWVRYEYADPALESLSAGQKTLIRLGAAHHQQMRIKLTSLRAALTVLGRPVQPVKSQ